MSILITLFFCHFLADYTHLSTPWMLNAKRFGTPWLPILMHASVHGILMLCAMLLMGVDYRIAMQLWLFQVCMHFVIDLWKGKMNVWFPALQSPANKWHWVVFGLDQYMHALVILAMVYYLNQ